MKFYEQHKDKIREVIRYVIVGVATTAVSFGVYWLCNEVFHLHYAVSNAVSWVAAVTFAFFANRKIVFRFLQDCQKQCPGMTRGSDSHRRKTRRTRSESGFEPPILSSITPFFTNIFFFV